MTDIDTPGPTLSELRAAGADAHVARLGAELDAKLGATRRGRLALRLSRWYARLTTSAPPAPEES